MAVANSKKDVIRYVLKADRKLPPEEQTLFLLRPLSAVQLSTLEGFADVNPATGTARVQVGQQRYAAIKASLCGWERFRDEAGKDVPFVQDAGVRMVHGVSCSSPPTDDTLGMLQYEDWVELADAVRFGSKLTVGDVGN